MDRAGGSGGDGGAVAGCGVDGGCLLAETAASPGAEMFQCEGEGGGGSGVRGGDGSFLLAVCCLLPLSSSLASTTSGTEAARGDCDGDTLRGVEKASCCSAAW